MNKKKIAIICFALLPVIAFFIGMGLHKSVEQIAFKKANLTQANMDTIKQCIRQNPCAIYVADNDLLHLDSSEITSKCEHAELFTIYMVCFNISKKQNEVFYPWKKDTVNIQIINAQAQDSLAISIMLEDINSIIPDVYFRITKVKNPDIIIKYENKMSYKQILQDGKLAGYCESTHNYLSICKQKAEIHLLVDHEHQRRINMVLKHELLHALGFGGHYYGEPDLAIRYDCMALSTNPTDNCNPYLSAFEKRQLDIMYNKLKGVVVTKKQFKDFYDKESKMYYNKLKEWQTEKFKKADK